jgi:hypothetical protein
MKLKSFFLGISVAYLMFSCNPKEALEPTIDYPAFIVIDGDTVITRDDKEKAKAKTLNSTIYDGTKVIVPNYVKLKKAKYDKKNEEILKKGILDPLLTGKPLRVVATGNCPTSSTGSFNNESLVFSIPNLIANQMGVEFNTPFFEAEDYNGAITVEVSKDNYTGGPLPKLKQASNNLAIESIDKDGNIKLKKSKLTRVDNFSNFGGGHGDGMSNRNPISSYFARFNEGLSYDKRVLKESFDFLIDLGQNDEHTINKGLNDYVPRKPEIIYSLGYNNLPYLNYRLDLFSDLIKRKGLKGILIDPIFSVPDIFEQNLISVERVRAELKKYQKEGLLNSAAKWIYPDARIDSLLGNKVNMNLKPYIRNNEKILSFISYDLRDAIRIYDKPIKSALALQMGWPELDVNFIMVQIYLNKYVTYDGIKVSHSDLFDSNMIFNSKTYSYIVANEALRLINSHYGTTFPLYNTRDFLK